MPAHLGLGQDSVAVHGVESKVIADHVTLKYTMECH